jgi:hypothetical protein
MELLFVALGGALLGIAARYLLPGRQTHGTVLVPAVGTAVASIVWVALTWLGWTWDDVWIWSVSFILAAAVSVAAGIWLARSRTQGDRRMLHALMKTGHPGHA